MRDTRIRGKKTGRTVRFFPHRRRTKEICQTRNEGTNNKKKKKKKKEEKGKKCNILDSVRTRENRVSRLTVANGTGFIFSRKDAVFHPLFFPLP